LFCGICERKPAAGGGDVQVGGGGIGVEKIPPGSNYPERLGKKLSGHTPLGQDLTEQKKERQTTSRPGGKGPGASLIMTFTGELPSSADQ